MPNESTEQELQLVKAALVALEAKVNKEKAQKTEYLSAWRRENAEKIRAYRVANAERRKLSNKLWRLKNPDKVREYQKKSAKLSAEAARLWRKNNKARVAEYRRKHGHRVRPEQRHAWDVLNHAISAGKIMKPTTCSKCGIACTP